MVRGWGYKVGGVGSIHIIFFLFLSKNMLRVLIRSELPSNEYPQHMFSWRNKTNSSTFQLKKSNLSGAISEFEHFASA